MSGFERKTLPNGKPNPKYVDLCDEDEPVAGQKFACISFVSPEKILKKREMYLFDTFVKQWDFTKSMMKFNDFLQFIAYKYSLDNDKLNADFQEYVKEEDAKLKSESVEDDYKTFMDINEDKLNEKFNRDHSFQTSVRGIKIRGSFASQEEAEHRCTELRKVDPNHDIFVGKVGVWMPWDPDAYKTGRIEFMEEELNQLHQEKIKNEMKAKQEFDARVKETKRKAIEENIKMAEKSGNKLTQTMNDDGNLIGVKETINFDEREAAETDTSAILSELVKESLERSEKKDE
jgi:hypothetical protein